MQDVDAIFEELFQTVQKHAAEEIRQTEGGVHSAIPLVMLTCMALWACVLVGFIGMYRVAGFLTGTSLQKFTAGERHGGDMYWRLNRAHANVTENLPIFGAVVIVGTLLDVAGPTFSKLSILYMAARVMQTFAHVASGSTPFIFIRFLFFSTQMMCVTALALSIFQATMPALF